MTRILSPDEAGVAQAAALLRAGGLVALPTETVYGLGADAASGAAVARLYAAKGRPAFNPLIVHVAGAAEAEALGIAGRLRLAGHCDDMPAALMLADVVVSASVEPEGFGRAVIEAQAMERLVIATDHGGAAETVEHGVTGWRVPPGDAGALAAALDGALAMQPVDRRAMGARARLALTKDVVSGDGVSYGHAWDAAR